MKEQLTGAELSRYVFEHTNGPFGVIDYASLLGFLVMDDRCTLEDAQRLLEEFRNATGRNTDRNSATGTGNG